MAVSPEMATLVAEHGHHPRHQEAVSLAVFVSSAIRQPRVNNIGQSRYCAAPIVVLPGAHNGGIARNGDASAESVIQRRPSAAVSLADLSPAGAIGSQRKNIRRPLLRGPSLRRCSEPLHNGRVSLKWRRLRRT